MARQLDTRTADFASGSKQVSGPENEKNKADYLVRYRELRNREEADMAATRGAWKDTFQCQSTISALVGGNTGGTKSRDWLCKIDEQLRYRESKYSTAATNLRVFAEGAEVTPHLEGSVSWSIQSTGGMNSASFTLNNSEDNFIVTPANVCSGLDIRGWRIFTDKTGQAISDYSNIGWNTDESAKYQIYKHKWNKVFRDPANPEIDETGMWLYPLTPHSCIFNKHDCVRIFVRLAHVTGAWGVDDKKKKDYTDLWVPAFSGFIDAYDWNEDAVSGKRAVHIKCYDYRGLLDRMRVRMEGNPTGSETKLGQLKEGAGIAKFMEPEVLCAAVSGAKGAPVTRERYIGLINKYAGSAKLLIEVFTKAFYSGVAQGEAQNGRLGQQSGAVIAEGAGTQLKSIAKNLICALVKFDADITALKASNKTSVDFTVTANTDNQFYKTISTARLESDEKVIKQFCADAGPGGNIRKFADGASAILALPALTTNTLQDYQAASQLLREKVAELSDANTSWLPGGLSIPTNIPETSGNISKRLQLQRAALAKDKQSFSALAAAIIVNAIKGHYDKLTSEAQTSFQQKVSVGGFNVTVSAASGSFVNTDGKDWGDLLASGQHGAQLDAASKKARDWYQTAANITNDADAKKLLAGADLAINNMNVVARAAVEKIGQLRALAQQATELMGNKPDIKQEQRALDLQSKIINARSNNDANRGQSKEISAVTGSSGQVNPDNKEVMSKADLLTVDASFPERMAKMYGDLVRQLDRDAHPLAGKTFEGSVEWLTLMNLPTWKGYQFKLKDYAQTTAGATLQDWNKLALFGAVARPLSYAEVSEIGRGTVTEIDDVKGAFSPVQPFVHMLLPENGTGAMTIVQQHLQSNVANQSAFRYTTRLSLLNEICGILDYQFYISPFGDMIFEFPHYNVLPSDFGPIFRGAYTVAAELRTCRIASEVGEMNTAWVLEGFQKDVGLESVTTGNATMLNQFSKYVIVAPMLVRRVGAKVKYLKIDMPGVGGALGDVPQDGKGKEPSIRQMIAYAFLAIQRELGHSESMDVEHNYRPYLLPNRPLWVVHRQRIGLIKTVTYTVDVYKGLGTAKCDLGYIRSMYRDGTFRNVAGGWRNTVDYAGIFAGYLPKVKFGASAKAEATPEGAETIKELASKFNEDYGWALGAKMNGVFCTPAVGTQTVVLDPTGQGNIMTRYPARAPYPQVDSNSPPGESTGTGLVRIDEAPKDFGTKYKDQKSKDITALLAKKKILTGPKPRSKRNWRDIYAIMVHHTGYENKEERIAESSRTASNYHFIIARSGKVYMANHPQLMIWHGHGLSQHSIGIEIDGNFAGLMNDPTHGGKPYFWTGGKSSAPSIPTNAQLDALDTLVRELADMLKKNGTSLKYIYAHRQSAASRESDAGQIVWQHAVLKLQSELGLQKTTETFTYTSGERGEGGGNPIPKEWDPAAKSSFFDSHSAKAEMIRKHNDAILSQIAMLEGMLASMKAGTPPAVYATMVKTMQGQIYSLKKQMRAPY